MARSPEPYLRRRFRPWVVGHWEMWQLRAPVVITVLLVCGLATVLIGVQAVTILRLLLIQCGVSTCVSWAK